MTMTPFRPSVHGFAFGNSWTFDEYEKATIRDVVRGSIIGSHSMLSSGFGQLVDIAGIDDVAASWVLSGLPQRYGLCGGMAFAALDYYRANIPVPRGDPDRVPVRTSPEGARLRSYLWTRLLDSLRDNGSTFMLWMGVLHLIPETWPLNGGTEWLHRESRVQWARLRKHIDAGRPRPLGLVGSSKDPFSNHQVLAYGYDITSTGLAKIYVYDMNCPDAEQTIRLNLRDEPLSRLEWESCSSRKRGPLRGFFVEEYHAKTPPRIASEALSTA